MNCSKFGVKLKPNKKKKKYNPLSTRKSSRQKYVFACANMFPYSLPPDNNPIAVNKYYYYIIIIIIPLTGLRNTEKATLLKVRYIHNENEMTILKLYILWLCGDINIRHKINYQ